MHFVVVKPMGHGSCILGHGSVFVWVSGSRVTAYDLLPALLYGATLRNGPSIHIHSSKSQVDTSQQEYTRIKRTKQPP